MNQFLSDVLKGLTAKEKYLPSKYFYNEAGDRLFQKIMQSCEYYLTRCEMEIFTQQTKEIASALMQRSSDFDVIELGAGDATKSVHLLEELNNNNINFTYYPVDISSSVVSYLKNNLPNKIPGLKVEGLNGEYLQMLEKAKTLSTKAKAVLFLGSNIGNIPPQHAERFCSLIRQQLVPGDLLLIGFDLKKDPQVILDAYNDKEGLTALFNLNLLVRINQELASNFNVQDFHHYPTYDPFTGTCKSYLVSQIKQEVSLDGQTIHFEEGEPIHTEISQKYSVEQIDKLARNSGFVPLKNFYDSKEWFVDAIWVCK